MWSRGHKEHCLTLKERRVTEPGASAQSARAGTAKDEQGDQLLLFSDSAFLGSCWLYVQSPANMPNKQIYMNAIMNRRRAAMSGK
jgi:hypothetical protein